ncbi:hypothetical protein MVLG_05424 [Microbotryum lychnidis-dioicae p1A1 Lamole]|uniref:Glycosyl hydrolase family 13 catalytic domain-containing protein n=1 Tax=Microbotryum lychnidis-dioicae (strain p1A1 Lamole / MvSl-1064) TaxID=683840 RepID=U5HE78_USTV1|nr:hypothetical protein MVLG_05424 [Microbotryum lychnidis-dioicae p1A1 Lamole]|eukprot:KDE04133.1 hypothetical protein MVLG_05424 [Microbotryum lychnidis-dioicae p1A1 Lamole]
MPHQRHWWKEGVVYQIFPRSFLDSNGDGEGDIPGITAKMDYLKHLGVDILWISPFFESPQKDNGYDISDFKNVHAPFGTVADVEDLIKGCHDRGMKILFDLVINHTSSEHEWFRQSRSSKTNPYRDYYIWRPAKYIDGVRHPPNNWRAVFGGSCWEWDEGTEEYYLHYYVKEQPDVNWENPKLRQALYDDAIKFWLDKGCDGFRVDTCNKYSKFTDFPDAKVIEPDAPYQNAIKFLTNGPRLHEFLREMHDETYAKYDCMTIGELGSTPLIEDVLKFVAAKERKFNMVIQFELSRLDHGPAGSRFHLMTHEWRLSKFKEITARYQRLTESQFDAWGVTYLENHDQGRSVPRYGSDKPEHRVNSAKMLATFLLTVSGTPIIYQGEEIGMINCPKEWEIEDEYKDVATINQWAEMKATAAATNDTKLLVDGKRGIQQTARDHARTPMQWNDDKNAGFSTAENTWMRAMDSYKEINVAKQQGVDSSPLEHYRRLLALRKEHKDVFVYGHFEPSIDENNDHTYIYLKRSEDRSKKIVVALNFSGQAQTFQAPEGLTLVESLKFEDGGRRGVLGPFEAQLYMT